MTFSVIACGYRLSTTSIRVVSGRRMEIGEAGGQCQMGAVIAAVRAVRVNLADAAIIKIRNEKFVFSNLVAIDGNLIAALVLDEQMLDTDPRPQVRIGLDDGARALEHRRPRHHGAAASDMELPLPKKPLGDAGPQRQVRFERVGHLQRIACFFAWNWTQGKRSASARTAPASPLNWGSKGAPNKLSGRSAACSGQRDEISFRP